MLFRFSACPTPSIVAPGANPTARSAPLHSPLTPPTRLPTVPGRATAPSPAHDPLPARSRGRRGSGWSGGA